MIQIPVEWENVANAHGITTLRVMKFLYYLNLNRDKIHNQELSKKTLFELGHASIGKDLLGAVEDLGFVQSERVGVRKWLWSLSETITIFDDPAWLEIVDSDFRFKRYEDKSLYPDDTRVNLKPDDMHKWVLYNEHAFKVIAKGKYRIYELAYPFNNRMRKFFVSGQYLTSRSCANAAQDHIDKLLLEERGELEYE